MTVEEQIAEAVTAKTAEQLEPIRSRLAAVLEVLERGTVPQRRLTRQETAEHYSVSVRSVDSWLRQGCPALRLGGPGGSPRLSPVELDAWHHQRSQIGQRS